jgi:hypothetical protein
MLEIYIAYFINYPIFLNEEPSFQIPAYYTIDYNWLFSLLIGEPPLFTQSSSFTELTWELK